MNQGTPNTDEASSEKISIKDLMRRLYDGRMIILLGGLLGLLFGLLFLLRTPMIYSVEMSVAPPLENMSQNSSLEGSALASIGLSSLSSTVSPEPFKRYTYLLTSQIAAEKLQKDHHIMQIIFKDSWDAQTQSWKPRSGIGVWIRKALAAILGRPASPTTPGIQDLVGFLSGNVSVTSPELGSPIRGVSLRYGNAADAAKFLLWLHQAVDGIVRADTLGRTKNMIEYLKYRLPVVDNSNEREALSHLLVTREQNLMLLAAGGDYSAVVLDPPNPVNAVPYPSIGRTMILSIAMGLGLGIVISLTNLASLLTGWWRARFYSAKSAWRSRDGSAITDR